MCVFKYHAFIYFLRPPPWYGTILIYSTTLDPMRTKCMDASTLSEGGGGGGVTQFCRWMPRTGTITSLPNQTLIARCSISNAYSMGERQRVVFIDGYPKRIILGSLIIGKKGFVAINKDDSSPLFLRSFIILWAPRNIISKRVKLS